MKIRVRAVRGMKFRWDLEDLSDEEKSGRRIEQLAIWGMAMTQVEAISEARRQAEAIKRATSHHKTEPRVIEV